MNLKEDSKNIFVYGMGLLTYFGKPRILKTGANVPHGCPCCLPGTWRMRKNWSENTPGRRKYMRKQPC